MPDMTKLRELAAAVKGALAYRDHLFGCDVHQTEVCTCGMVDAANRMRNAMNAILADARATAPEPPGSVAGDEYDAAARRCVEFLLIPICGVNPNSKEELIRLIGGEFRAACGKREAELKELQEAWDMVGEQQVRVCLPPNHYSVEMGMDAFRRLQLAIDTLLAARAKQGKETRT